MRRGPARPGLRAAAGAAGNEDEDAGASPAGYIDVRLDTVLAARAMTLTELADRVGLTLVNLSVLKNGRARAIRFTTLARLCDVLCCQPADLLSYQPDGLAADRGPDAGRAGSEPSGIGCEEHHAEGRQGEHR